MTKQFKAGDKVRVIDNAGCPRLQLGSEHIIDGLASSRGRYNLVGDNNRGSGFFNSRFELVTEEAEKVVAIDFTKPVETVEGAPFELLTTTGRGDKPIKGYIGKSETVYSFYATGHYYHDRSTSGYNLRNVVPKPVEVVRYYNVYIYGVSGDYDSREAADKSAAATDRIGVKRVVFTKGEFDA